MTSEKELIIQELLKLQNNKNDEIIKQQCLEYKNALINIKKDIFKLPDYTKLLYGNQIAFEPGYIKLIATLTILKNNEFITPTEDQINNLKNNTLFIKCVNEIENKYQLLQSKINNKNEIEEIIEEIKNNESIINNYLLKRIIETLKNNNVNEKIIQNIELIILKYNILEYEKTKETIIKIDENELIELFQKYGYDYKKIPDEFKEKLLKRDNIQIIEDILITFKNNNIYFNETNKSLLYILIKSNKEIIEKTINQIKKYTSNINELIQKIPSAFIESNKNNKNNINTNEIEKNNQKTEINGSSEDFYKNMILIEQLGYDIKETLYSTPSIFIKSNKKIKSNATALMQYGFPQNLARLNLKLSALKSTNILNTLDQFIELEELNYILANTSRLILEQDSYIFYRLYYAKKYNENEKNTKKYIIHKEFKKKIVYNGIITKPTDKTLNINENNKLIRTNTIKPNIFGNIIDKELDEYINKENIPTYKTNDNLIQQLDEKYLENRNNYIFNKKRISRAKTIRIYSIISEKYISYDKKDLLLYALTYNSILDASEFNYIKQCVTTLKKEGEKTL